MRLPKPLETPVVAYLTVGMAMLVAVLAALTGLGGSALPLVDTGGGLMSMVSGAAPLHSIEIQCGEDGRYLTAEGLDVRQLAAKIKNLPPEVPAPVVLVKVPASRKLQAIAPILKEMESAGIKKIAVLME